ncbi:MAG: hypothetical protein KQ78_02148 [Candidatus Izimaplasma bacterium HR2]|nr:MAG: hypothetical protein KQ78_02148 [Candidatus Izimaplasma bacterium HR2]
MKLSHDELQLYIDDHEFNKSVRGQPTTKILMALVEILINKDLIQVSDLPDDIVIFLNKVKK